MNRTPSEADIDRADHLRAVEKDNHDNRITHTPGPWEWSRMLIPSKQKDRRSGFVVNQTDKQPENLSLPIRICDMRCAPDNPFAECEANARLIAAAPDLLAALEAMVDSGGEGSDSEQKALGMAYTAIEKAKGA